MGKIKDLTGQRFGKLTVVRLHPERTKQGRTMWLCKCDCGGERVVVSANLLHGRTKSCGCMRSLASKFHKKLDTRSMKKRYSGYRVRSKRRGLEFTLTFEEFLEILNQPCSYCGCDDEGMTIDRVDSNKGYITGNCITACLWCNRMKNNLSKEEFLGRIRRICGYNKLR